MEVKREQIVYVDGKPHIKAKVVMLSTRESAKVGDIVKPRYGEDFHILTKNDSKEYTKTVITQHLYIISDEEIKPGDWIYRYEDNKVFQSQSYFKKDSPIKDGLIIKVIATTDTSLVLLNEQYFDVNKKRKSAILEQKNLPQPSQQFIEKYIEEYNKGNVITDVLVEVEDNGDYVDVDGMDINDTYWKSKWELKLDSQNQITIRKQKDSWTRKEVIVLLNKLGYDLSQLGGRMEYSEIKNKWFEENL